jgi:hypothetical protein
VTDDELEWGARRRLRIQLFVGGLVLLAVALSITKLPACLLERAKTAADVCLDEIDDRDTGDPASCRQGGSLALPKLVPHLRAEALAEEKAIERRIAGTMMHLATSAKPDAAARTRAVAAMAAVYPDPVERAERLSGRGAHEAVAAIDLGTTTPVHHGGHAPAFAALALGNVDRARAALASGRIDHYDGATRAGALACLLGDTARGLALLGRGDAMWVAINGDKGGYADARFGAVYCGGDPSVLDFEPRRVAGAGDVEIEVARAFDPAFQRGRRAAFGMSLLRQTTLSRAALLGSFALAIGGDVELPPLRLLGMLSDVRAGAVQQPFGAPYPTPWAVLAPRDGYSVVDYVPPGWLEAAAARLDAAAAAVPAKITDDQARANAIDNDVRADMRAALRRAANTMWIQAAVYRARIGDRAGAEKAIAAGRAPGPSLQLAVVQLAIGDAAGAIASLDAWEAANASAEPAMRSIARVDRALALASTGDHAAAHRAALEAAAISSNPAVHWVVLATAIRSNAALDKLPIGKDDEAPAQYAAAIAKRSLDGAPTFFDSDARQVLPAAVTVVYHAASLAGDADVFVDTVLDEPKRSSALARAEAARWRGDTAGATAWQARADAIEKLISDDRGIALADLAEVW